MLEPELLWEPLPLLPLHGVRLDPRRNVEGVSGLVDSRSHSSHTHCCTTRCCLTSHPRQNWRRRHPTRRPTNLRLGYAPKSSFRSSWILFTRNRGGTYFLFLSYFYQCLTSHWMLFFLILRKFCKGRQSVANLSDLTKQLTQQPGRRLAGQAKHRRLVLICLFYSMQNCAELVLYSTALCQKQTLTL